MNRLNLRQPKPDTKPESELEAPQEPQQHLQPEPVSYSPSEGCSACKRKRRKQPGRSIFPDDLDRMLAEGTITQEDYNDCYPTDGAG